MWSRVEMLDQISGQFFRLKSPNWYHNFFKVFLLFLQCSQVPNSSDNSICVHIYINFKEKTRGGQTGAHGHFLPARTFKMAREEFQADTGWNIEV